MNKTRKRSIEKHRAKARKFEARRKEAGAPMAAATSRTAGANMKQRPATQRAAEPALAANATGGEEDV